MDWYLGQKVVCVNGKFPAHFYEWGDHVPVEGETYTIRWMGELPNGLTGVVGLGFLLVEIVNPSFGKNCEVAFHHSRFRPLCAEGTGAGEIIREAELAGVMT
jgi:hypothetical protein